MERIKPPIIFRLRKIGKILGKLHKITVGVLFECDPFPFPSSCLEVISIVEEELSRIKRTSS